VTAAAIPSGMAGVPGLSMPQKARLLPLREELTLHPGPQARDGTPTWTLQDPATNRFYRIGWLEFEILARWDLADIDAIAESIREQTPIPVTSQQVEAFARFLLVGNLVQVRGEPGMERLLRQAAAQRKGPAKWLLKHYLFFRIPLVKPDRFLAATLPYVAWMFSRGFLMLVLTCALAGGYLVLRRWDGFVNSFLHFFSLEGAVLFGASMFTAKLLHELGHAYTARRFGCRVPTMGMAFLVMWPVLYTDTSDAWRLTSKRRRLAIGAAGMAAELALAAFATVAWSFLPDGPLRSAAFLLASSTWILTLLINLNPFMRFDGYFLLSVLLEVANLQDRAFALARWRLREILFGFGDPPPEHFPPRLHRILLIYAYGTWIYRFFLFFGIALLVYHMFFKVLGIFLMLVEVGWFIARPILHELGDWAKRRDAVRINGHSLATLAGLGGLIALILIPWHNAVPASAILRAEQQTQIFVPFGAQLQEVRVKPGDRVAAGAVLFRFGSPDLHFDLAQAERRIEVLRWQTQFQGFSRDLLERNQVAWRELESAMTEAAGFRTEQARLDVTAPFAGTIVEIADPLAPGEWLKQNSPLAMLIDPASSLIEAYVDESDLRRVRVGTAGTFHPDDMDLPSIPGTVIAVDDASTRVLPEPYVASTHGGDVATRVGHDGVLVPETPVYRILLRPHHPLPAPALITRGWVRLQADQESFVVRLWRIALGVLVRESGF
jgi:putative peptide zinc metalloprotease protein